MKNKIFTKLSPRVLTTHWTCIELINSSLVISCNTGRMTTMIVIILFLLRQLDAQAALIKYKIKSNLIGLLELLPPASKTRSLPKNSLCEEISSALIFLPQNRSSSFPKASNSFLQTNCCHNRS